MYRRFGKRLFDLILSSAGIVVLALPMLLIAAAIRIDSPGPALFRQKRVGRDKRFFSLLKFRSMRRDAPADVPTHLFAHPECCVTRVGRILRRTSLDELPQLFNIFVGQMSVVGPRPALWNQDDLVAARDRCGANRMRPGLTGWAQINGRDELSIPEKVRYDGEYAACLLAGRGRGFRMDCKCLFGTIGNVLRGDGIAEGGTEPHAAGQSLCPNGQNDGNGTAASGAEPPEQDPPGGNSTETNT